MSSHEPLRGSCSCGRNQYLIRIPNTVTDHARIYFDSSRDHRRSHGAPITAWLRVPLSWYQSYTQSYFPDESHTSIRRTFTPHHAPHTKRVFCGFCGTPLTYWTEEPREEADFMSVAIGSLVGDDQRILEDLDLLPEDFEEEVLDNQQTPARAQTSSTVVIPSSANVRAAPGISRSYRHGTVGGIPWFEEMIEGSRLGRLLRTRRGVGVSGDQSTTIEWEISEWHGDGTAGDAHADSSSSGQAIGKRKRGQDADAEETKPSQVRTDVH